MKHLLIFVFFTISLVSAAIPFSKRIINGQPATISQYPYQVSVEAFFLETEKFIHICGGAILSRRHVLTGAHCITFIPYRVVAGIDKLDSAESQGQISLVLHAYLHPRYDEVNNVGASPNDLAVLRLATRLTLSNTVKAVSLPQPGVVPTGKGTISGWGAKSPEDFQNAIFINQLQSLSVDIITYQQCERIVNTTMTGFTKYVDSTMFCSVNNNNGQCFGDTGGPIVQNGVLIGVMSWMYFSPCGKSNTPSTYGRVSANVDWIKQQMVVE